MSSSLNVSDNKYANCPPRMADGRHFTDYRPRCYQQYSERYSNGIQSSFDYRMFLTRNATDIMMKNAAEAYNVNMCGPCVSTAVPELTKQTCDDRVCRFDLNNPYGLGVGRK